jgi:hypothetical protein
MRPRPVPRRPPPPAGVGAATSTTGVAADLRERSQAAPLFRAADKTQEWAESRLVARRLADAGPALIPPTASGATSPATTTAGPFLSPHIGDAAHSLAAALCALAVRRPALHRRRRTRSSSIGGGASPSPRSPALAARTSIAASTARRPARILVGQSYFRADDRWAWDGAEQRREVRRPASC